MVLVFDFDFDFAGCVFSCDHRFDRSGGVRHSEFDTLCEQEGEYLDIIASKILAAGPTLVLVEKNVARSIQDKLREVCLKC